MFEAVSLIEDHHVAGRDVIIVSTSGSEVVEPIGQMLGADQVIDYNATDFRKVVNNVDAVFETVGGDVAMQSFAVLKPGGRAAFIASGGQAPKPDRGDVTSLRPAVGRDRPPLERIAELYKAGAVRPPPVRLFKLADAAEAVGISKARHLKGKLVFKLR